MKPAERGEPNPGVVERARHGDQSAFSQLVGLYQAPVYNLAYRMLGTAVEAEDAAQETFLRAYSQIKSFKAEYKFSSWLLSIASHYCIDRLRRNKFRWLSLDAETMVETLRSDKPDPEETALRNERSGEAQKLLQALPPAYRVVVTLRYWNEMSVEEIAQVTHDSVSNVKVKLFRARQMMAQAYVRETQMQLRPALVEGLGDAS